MKKLAILFFVLPFAAFSQIGIGVRGALNFASTSSKVYSLEESWVGGVIALEYKLPLPATAIEVSGGVKSSMGAEGKSGAITDTFSNSGSVINAVVRYYFPTKSQQFRVFIGGGFESFSFARTVGKEEKGSGVTVNGIAPIGFFYKINPKIHIECLTDFDFLVKSKPEEDISVTKTLFGINAGLKIYL